ncbi:LOW QUALITY PROTEIN: tetratricopeptide repeat protein 34 [Thomomys bottae]
MTSAQKLAACLCQEGDAHLARGEPALAAAFYLAAFSCHAPSAVQSVQAALAEARGGPVVAMLEAWGRGESQIPDISWDGMAVVSLTGALASAFLAALCPDHPASVLHVLATLLAHGHHEEVAERCGALLGARAQQALELQLTRALAWVLSGTQAGKGVAAYLHAFASSSARTVAFIRTHQLPHLPALLSALQACISGHTEAADNASWRESNCRRLLAALDPGSTRLEASSPEALLRGGRFEACLEACSQALQSDSTGSQPQGERLAALLVTRAVAAFFLDGRGADTLRDLHDAFGRSPAGARARFQALLSAGDQERVRALARDAADLGFARFREAVRSRPELREDSGREPLAPVIRALRVLLRVAPAPERPSLGARLAECLLLAGDVAAARALCDRLLRPGAAGDPAGSRAQARAPVQALRGLCALHAGDARRAQEDFQAVVARGSPPAAGCVRALCGRGLLRVLRGSAFLGALDFVTACRLRPDEALLVAKAFVPWNQRGLLRTVLREEGREMLLRARGPGPASRGRAAGTEVESPAQEGDAQGVYQLASLLLELDADDEAARLLVADSLYCLGRLAEAHKALRVALSRRPQAAPVLARLALLQLRRGFCYDTNQLVKKVVQSGDTACLKPTLDVFCPEDRQLLRQHCHARALSILRSRPGGVDSGAHTREAIAYLSLAIFAGGSEASESLLTRARCYALLGQKKTALFDFHSVLRAEPRNVQALCGRALVYLALDQLQEAVDDVVSALKLNSQVVVPEIRSVKPEAQALLTQGLYAHCRTLLGQRVSTTAPREDKDIRGLVVIGEALVSIDAAQPRWHILLTDILSGLGIYEEAGGPLREALRFSPPSEAAQARRGLLRLKKGEDVPAAARDLQCLAETDAPDLGFLLRLLETPERQSLAQAAAQGASTLLDAGRPEQALGYCSLAVLAAEGTTHLRLRATCLAQLQEFSRALGDLDRVLQESAGDRDLPALAEDLCFRGRLLLSLGDEEGAARAFAQALQLSPTQTQSSLCRRPGRASTARVFLRLGQRCLEGQFYEEAWTAAQNGLLMDPEHSGLKRLKARTRREASSGCRLH